MDLKGTIVTTDALNCQKDMAAAIVGSKGEKSEEEYRYYICSIGEDVEEFERAARGHWGVEVNLHWQLDFTFRDDKNTSMAKTGAKNLQIMKKMYCQS